MDGRTDGRADKTDKQAKKRHHDKAIKYRQRQNKRRHDKTRQDQTKPDKTIDNKTQQGKTYRQTQAIN